jgi:hypothetical protein
MFCQVAASVSMVDNVHKDEVKKKSTKMLLEDGDAVVP